MAADSLTSLERGVLAALLRHDHPTFDALREQAAACQVPSRELTGVGFHARLTVEPDAPVTSLGDLQLEDVVADIDGLQRGAGFVLRIEAGRIADLEGFSYDEPWPDRVDAFTVRAEHPAGGTLTDLEAVEYRIASRSDDRARLARGEPAWGDVIPGTDEVNYYAPTEPGIGPPLCRTVAMEGAFYIESYRGHGRWEVDSDPFMYLTSVPLGEPPRSRELTPRDAGRLMAQLDEANGPGSLPER